MLVLFYISPTEHTDTKQKVNTFSVYTRILTPLKDLLINPDIGASDQ